MGKLSSGNICTFLSRRLDVGIVYGEWKRQTIGKWIWNFVHIFRGMKGRINICVFGLIESDLFFIIQDLYVVL